jgi:hypothetical protein
MCSFAGISFGTSGMYLQIYLKYIRIFGNWPFQSALSLQYTSEKRGGLLLLGEAIKCYHSAT